MDYKQYRRGSKFFFWIGILSGILMLLACGGSGSSTDAIFDTGALNFRIAYQGAEKGQRFQAAVIDCAGEGIATIEAEVYDSNFTSLSVGGPWDCDAGHGTIRSVPAGSDRIIVSEKSDPNDPIIDTTTTVENYTPSDLSDTKTYYWHVAAIDTFQHQGVVSSSEDKQEIFSTYET